MSQAFVAVLISVFDGVLLGCVGGAAIYGGCVLKRRIGNWVGTPRRSWLTLPFDLNLGFSSSLKTWISTKIKRVQNAVVRRVIPGKVDRDGYYMYVNLSGDMELFKATTSKIPDGYWHRWNNIGVWIVAVFLGVLVGVLTLIAAGTVLRLLWHIIHFQEVIASIMEFVEVATKTHDPSSINLSPSDIIWPTVVLVGSITIGAILLYLYFFVVFSAVLPGVGFHELGHAFALDKNGVKPASYGILFVGPIPMGAYIKPEHDYRLRLGLWPRLQVASAGILHSVIYGLILIAVSIITGPGFPSYIIGILGGVHILNAGFNAIPHKMLDGGHFVAALRDHWWSFDEVLDGVHFGW